MLSRHFEKSHVPLALPRLLPDDWKGCFALLVIVFVLSSFLDNIAAALIGGAMAHTLFKKVHIGYLAAHRRRVERRRRRQRGRRHHHDHDVDRRRRSARRAARVRGGGGRAGRLGAGRRLPAARLLADHAARLTGSRASIGRASASSSAILVAAIAANVVINIRYPELAELVSVHRRGGVDRDPADGANPAARLGTAWRSRPRRRLPAVAGAGRIVDAGRAAAGTRAGKPPSAWASSRRSSTTSP